MKMFDHPNVLCLLGISVYEEVPCVILPFMSNGDLKTYMRNNQEVGKSRNLIGVNCACLFAFSVLFQWIKSLLL